MSVFRNSFYINNRLLNLPIRGIECPKVRRCMNVLKQNISIIEWDIVLMSFVCLSVLLVEGTDGLGENHRPVACH
jgi:hypothetical protein